jgi:hypothetical protein
VAGKVTGPGGTPPGSSNPVGESGKSGSVGSTGESPAPFADKLKSSGAPTPPASATGAARKETAGGAGSVTDLAADLKAGKISPKAAVDRVIDRVVDKQLGANAPAATREKLRTALENAVADDPLLADKIRGLS